MRDSPCPFTDEGFFVLTGRMNRVEEAVLYRQSYI